MRIPVVGHARQAGIVDAPALEHGRDVVALRRIHQAMPLELRHGGDAGAARHQHDRGGVLEDHRQHHEVAAVGAVEQDARRAHPEVSLAGRHRLGGVHLRTALANLHIKAGVAVKAFLEGRVIPGELKLVLPFELQRDVVQRPYR